MGREVTTLKFPPPSDNRRVLVWVIFMAEWHFGRYYVNEDEYHLEDMYVDDQERWIGPWHELPPDPPKDAS